MRWVVICLAIATSTSAIAFEDVDGSLAKLPLDLRAPMLMALDLQLADGPSTRFRALVPDKGQVCGLLNTKNRMGAYTGYTHFLFVIYGTRQVFIEEPDGMNSILKAHCRLP